MTTLNLQVSASLDDSRENGGTGANSPTATTINMQTADRIGGWRWQTTIPNGATIDSVVAQLHFDSAGSDSPHALIAFEDVDDAPPFNADNGHLAGRLANQTAATIEWQAADLGVGFSTSPSLAVSLQQVVNRAGFDAGAVALIWDSLGSPNDDSVIAAYDGSTANAGKLDIDYTAGEPEPEPEEGRLPYRSNRKAVEFDIAGLVNDDDIKTGLFCLSETTWELAYNLVLWYGHWRSRYYFIDTDDSLKTITDEEYEQVLAIYQLAIEELQLGDLNAGLNAIANAISELADRDCDCAVADCGSGGAAQSDGIPTTVIDAGINPNPEIFEDYEAYRTYKCNVAEFIVERMQADVAKLQLLNWGTITFYGALEMVAVIAATIATPIIGDDVLAVVGAIALISGAMSGPLEELDDALIAVSDELICAMFTAGNVEIAKIACREILAVQLDSQSDGAVLFVAQAMANMFMTFANLNTLFEGDETVLYPASSFDCSTCGPMIFGRLPEFPDAEQYGGSGDLTLNDVSRVLTSTLHPNGFHYITIKNVEHGQVFFAEYTATSLANGNGRGYAWYEWNGTANVLVIESEGSQNPMPFQDSRQASAAVWIGSVSFDVTVTLGVEVL